jgi:hypothetical protein
MIALLRSGAAMPRYYFDICDGDEIAPDEEGLELPTIEAAWAEAARSLADLAQDAIPIRANQGPRHQMTIEVRDDDGPVLAVKVLFEGPRHRLDA